MKGYITLQEAADLLGVSRSTMYRRALAAEQAVNSDEQHLNSDEQPVNSKPASVVHDKKRYVSMDWVLSEMDAAETAEQAVNSREQSLNSAEQGVNSSADRIRQLENDLLAAQGEAATLRATVAAQEAHIESLKAALDKAQTTINQEQAIRMASLQKRLPAPGKGFFEGVKNFFSKKGET